MRGRGSPCAETKCARAETQWTEPWWHYRTFISERRNYIPHQGAPPRRAASWQAPRTVGKRKGLISDQKHFHSQSFHFESSQVKSIQVKAAIWLSVVYV